MRSPRSGAVRAVAAAFAAASLAALTALSAPAYAEDPSPSAGPSTSPSTPAESSADLSVKVQSSQSTPSGGGMMTKIMTVTVENKGPNDATGVTVTFTVKGYDPAEKVYRVEPANGGVPCSGADKGKDRVYTCSLSTKDSTLKSGATNHELIFAFDHAIKASGDVAEGVVAVTSKAKDPDAKNNTQPFTISIVKAGVDVSANSGTDVTIDPGKTGSFSGPDFVSIYNEGSTPVKGISISMTLPPYATFEKDYTNCEYSEDLRKANCEFPDVVLDNQEGIFFAPTEPVRITLAKNAPGPLSLGRVSVTAAALDMLQPQAFKGTVTGQHFVHTNTRAGLPDQAPGDNTVEFAVFSTANPADLAVTATAPEGKVGDTVSVDVTVSDKGPADSPTGTVLTVTAPTGSSIVSGPADCKKKDGTDGVWVCETTATIPMSQPSKGTFKLKIDSKDVKDGKVTVESRFTDTDAKNNEAAVKVNVLAGAGGGSLPKTGQSLTYIAVAAAALVVVGGALVLLSRRRRTEAAGVGVLDGPEAAGPDGADEAEGTAAADTAAGASAESADAAEAEATVPEADAEATAPEATATEADEPKAETEAESPTAAVAGTESNAEEPAAAEAPEEPAPAKPAAKRTAKRTTKPKTPRKPASPKPAESDKTGEAGEGDADDAGNDEK